jgi:amino acid permease
MREPEGDDYFYKSFVRMWLCLLAIIFLRPLIEWLFKNYFPESFWFQYYSFGFSLIVFLWFSLLARKQRADELEKFRLYRQRKRLEAAQAD